MEGPLFEIRDNYHLREMVFKYILFNYLGESIEVPPNIGTWDTSRVTDMSNLFYPVEWNSKYKKIIININGIDKSISEILNEYDNYEENTIQEAIRNNFNEPLSSWNTRNVTNMSYMFYNAEKYDQPLPESFDTRNVTNMEGMFADAISYDKPLPESFNTENVTNMDIMFGNAKKYNKPLPESFNTRNVTNMGGMFQYAISYNQPLPESFNTENVTNMSFMFKHADSFNEPLPISFDTRNVRNMEGMFQDAAAFNQNLNMLNVKRVTNFKNIFLGANAFNKYINCCFWYNQNKRVIGRDSIFKKNDVSKIETYIYLYGIIGPLREKDPDAAYQTIQSMIETKYFGGSTRKRSTKKRRKSVRRHLL